MYKARKILSLLMAVILLIGMMPTSMLAEAINSPFVGGISQLSISGQQTVEVGKTIELSGEEFGFYHDWTSSDETIASVSSEGETATVRGLKACLLYTSKIIKRKGRVMVICENPKQKQKQG